MARQCCNKDWYQAEDEDKDSSESEKGPKTKILRTFKKSSKFFKSHNMFSIAMKTKAVKHWYWDVVTKCKNYVLNQDRTFVRTSNQRNTWSIYSLDEKEVEKSKDEIINDFNNIIIKDNAPEPAIVRVDTADEKNKEESNLNVKLKCK